MAVFCYGLPFNLRSVRSASASTEADVGHAEVCKDHKGFTHSIELGSMLRWKSWPHIRQWSVDGFNIAGTFQTQRQIETERERVVCSILGATDHLHTSFPLWPWLHCHVYRVSLWACGKLSCPFHCLIFSRVPLANVNLWQSSVFIRWFRTLHLLPLP